jgi:hypothetical protein
MAGYSIRECPACHKTGKFRNDYQTCCKGKLETRPEMPVAAPITEKDRITIELEKLRIKKSGNAQTIEDLKERVLELESEREALLKLSGTTPQIFDVKPRISASKSESAAVVVWSDWHSEEEVLPGQVSNKNEFNLEIGYQRFQNLLHGTLAWYKIESQKTAIKTLVIACLGDFISGSIHEELMESNLLLPVDAIYRAQGMLATGIKHIRDNTPADLEIIVVCHSGNHGRMTKKQRISTEAGNSLEQFAYYTLRDHFKADPRIKFIVATGYHTFVRFFEGAYEIRFHHGHQINYQGGVGGITIPVNKAIAQWNKAHPVNLDVFGHFHTRFDGGNFIANGSLIGYNAYAVSIKASYEKPSQTFFLVNREFAEKTMVSPIFVDHDLPSNW